MPRPRTRPISNQALAARIDEIGKPYAEIATTINLVHAENGYASRYDPSSIGHWLTGRTPQAESIPAVVEAFSRLLQRPALHAADLGWPDADIEPDDPWSGDPIHWIIRLGRDDMLNRRSALTAGLYSLAAITTPLPAETARTRQGRSRTAGPSDVARIDEMTRLFSTADDKFGGGPVRSAVAAYLTGEVVPLLHGTNGRARPELFSSAAHLTYLAGFMTADDGGAGAAQRYYIEAVRLADEASDPIMKATALRALSNQALTLNHHSAALDLADAAATALPAGAPPRTLAWVRGMQAEAHAACGNKTAALDGLRRAERGVEQADSTPEHQWTGGYRREALEHQTGTVLARLGDLAHAEWHLIASQTLRPTAQRRSRSLIGTRLAIIQAQLHGADAAAHTVLELSEDLALVSSARVRRELAALRNQWQPHRSDPTVQAADDLIRKIHPNGTML